MAPSREGGGERGRERERKEKRIKIKKERKKKMVVLVPTPHTNALKLANKSFSYKSWAIFKGFLLSWDLGSVSLHADLLRFVPQFATGLWASWCKSCCSSRTDVWGDLYFRCYSQLLGCPMWRINPLLFKEKLKSLTSLSVGGLSSGGDFYGKIFLSLFYALPWVSPSFYFFSPPLIFLM